MIVDFSQLPSREQYRWMISTIIPRPIAFITTTGANGVVNLAPFSFFNGVCSDPPIVSVAFGARRGGTPKDTLRNIEESGELVINIVPESLAEAMVLTSGEFSPDESELEIAGLTAIDSVRVTPPRVQECPIAMECTLHQIVRIGDPAPAIVLATIVLMHISDEMLSEDGLPDSRRVRPLARLGGNLYAGLGELIELARPRLDRK